MRRTTMRSCAAALAGSRLVMNTALTWLVIAAACAVSSGCKRLVIQGPSLMLTDDEITARNLNCPTRFQFTFSEEEIEDLAAGLVPRRVRADARAMLDFDDLCRRNAERPERTMRRR